MGVISRAFLAFFYFVGLCHYYLRQVLFAINFYSWWPLTISATIADEAGVIKFKPRCPRHRQFLNVMWAYDYNLGHARDYLLRGGIKKIKIKARFQNEILTFRIDVVEKTVNGQELLFDLMLPEFMKIPLVS